jgi:hypothetical protein
MVREPVLLGPVDEGVGASVVSGSTKVGEILQKALKQIRNLYAGSFTILGET